LKRWSGAAERLTEGKKRDILLGEKRRERECRCPNIFLYMTS